MDESNGFGEGNRCCGLRGNTGDQRG
jgi:hypothetical protein